MQKKKILNLSIDQKLFEEGSAVAQRFVEYGELFEELRVVVYTKPGFKEKQLAPNVFVYPTNTSFKPLFFFDAYKIALKFVTKDMIVSSQEALTNLVGLRLKRKTGAELQVQIHTDFMSPFYRHESLMNYVRYMLYKWSIPKADYVRVVSRRILNSIQALITCLPENVKVLPLFVDTTKLENENIVIDLRKDYPQFDFILLMASRFEVEKNIPMALSVFKKVLKKFPKTGLILVGKGHEIRSIKRTIKRLRLQDNVVLQNWTTSLSSYYKTADAFLSTSNYEGYGLTLIEAAVLSLPIITTDIGVVGELFEKETDALVCEVKDSGCLFDNICRVIENIDLRRMLKLNAMHKAKLILMSKETYLKKYQEMFDSF